MQEVSNVEGLLLALNAVPVCFDGDAVRAILKCLTPDTVRLMWVAKEFQVVSPLLSSIAGCTQMGAQLTVFWLSIGLSVLRDSRSFQSL